jgi:pathogenesis-related protein 1
MSGSGGQLAGMAGTNGMMPGSGGLSGSGGMGTGGVGTGGMSGSGGMGSGSVGTGGMSGSGGMGSGGMGSGGMGSAGMNAGAGETGRMVGMTAAHNAVRAMADADPPLLPVTWSTELAQYAQAWADMQTEACDPQQVMHRSGQDLRAKGYGENLAASIGLRTDAQWAVDGWAGEVACWTYGTIDDPFRGGGTEMCDASCYMQMNSDGCGHYTQIVWRKTTQIGCGVSTCNTGSGSMDVWICNYAPAGNFVGEAPY